MRIRRLFRRYTKLTVKQKRLYSLLTVITLFTLLLYCLGISSFLIRSRLPAQVAMESLPTFTASPTLTATTVLLPEQTPTPTATLPPTPTQRPIPTFTPTPLPTPTPETITMTVVITATPGVTTTVVISATVTPTPILTPTGTITAETSLKISPPTGLPPSSASRSPVDRGTGHCSRNPAIPGYAFLLEEPIRPLFFKDGDVSVTLWLSGCHVEPLFYPTRLPEQVNWLEDGRQVLAKHVSHSSRI